MWQVLGAVIVIAAAVFAFQIAIILLMLAGLIWRPKETISLLVLGGTFTLIQAYPVFGTMALAGLLGFAYYTRKNRKQQDEESVIDAPSAPDD